VRYLDALLAEHTEQLRGELSYRPPSPPEQEPS